MCFHGESAHKTLERTLWLTSCCVCSVPGPLCLNWLIELLSAHHGSSLKTGAQFPPALHFAYLRLSNSVSGSFLEKNEQFTPYVAVRTRGVALHCWHLLNIQGQEPTAGCTAGSHTPFARRTTGCASLYKAHACYKVAILYLDPHEKARVQMPPGIYHITCKTQTRTPHLEAHAILTA